MLINDVRLELPMTRLTNESNQFSLDRAFYPTTLHFRSSNTSTTVTTSFSTYFVFSILPDISTSPDFLLAFVLSACTSPVNALSGQYFGLFTNTTTTVAPLVAIEFDTGRNPEFNYPDGNHVGMDLNSIVSIVTQNVGYYIDLGPLHYFLGINVTRTPFSLFLSQEKFAREIFQRADMSESHSISTPGEPDSKLSASSSSSFSDPLSIVV